ncbi:MAG: MFS transporter [Alphaproteobacteria bacterium]|nr:MFS transporter [Alphaproteobacteria bacterium]
MEINPQPSPLPRAVLALGLVSLLMDTSSELIHSLLPVYVVTTLGASTLSLGVLEGLAQAVASILKMFSGALSDWTGKRKALAVVGYGLSALTKPLFPLAQSMGLVFTARIADRIGKGIRGAPRDALIADVTPLEVRGAAYGLRQALDTVGAFLGPGLAILLMLLFNDNIRAVYWFAVIPAFACVVVLILGVEEPERKTEVKRDAFTVNRNELAKLGNAYWSVVFFGSILTLARFSEAFLVLRAQSAGLPEAWLPIVMVVMSLVYASVSYPAGKLSDRVDRRLILMIGMGVLVVADFVLAFASTVGGVLVGVGIWGLHMGLSEGLLTTLIADAAPSQWRGTAFGVFNLITGIVLLVASTLAGYLWEAGGPKATFLAGAVFTILAFAGLWSAREQKL